MTSIINLILFLKWDEVGKYQSNFSLSSDVNKTDEIDLVNPDGRYKAKGVSIKFNNMIIQCEHHQFIINKK